MKVNRVAENLKALDEISMGLVSPDVARNIILMDISKSLSVIADVISRMEETMRRNEMLRRNLDLWLDRRCFHRDYGFLSLKYCISRDRCRQIFMRMERRYTNFLNCKYVPFDTIEFNYFMYVKEENYDSKRT